MPNPIGFAQANSILATAPNLPKEQSNSLEVFENGKVIISKWQFTDEELLELNRNGGKIYVVVLGPKMQPIVLDVKDPFGLNPPTSGT